MHMGFEKPAVARKEDGELDLDAMVQDAKTLPICPVFRGID